MLYENEFKLMSETFDKSRVRITTAGLDCTVFEIMDDAIKPFFESTYSVNFLLKDVFGEIKPGVLYRFKDSFMLLYIAFILPVDETKKLIVIGPYVDEPIGAEKILEISELNGLAPQSQRVVNEFFASVPVVAENSALFLLLDAFCERLWHGSYDIVDIHNGAQMYENMSNASVSERNIDDTFFDMRNMERRYELENEIMNAVAMGSEHKVNQLFSSFTESSFEKRLNDPIRNFKNYCIIMNTLLRKAAERGGVHPMYLDKISTNFAHKIEGLSATHQVQPLMFDMFRSYCKLVRKHKTNNYSPIIKKAVTAIELDPSAELNLHTLAQKLRVSNVYLSSMFKKETGKTVTEYIRLKRLSHAEYLLKSTNLQIQTVALHCGMVDVQYFSKIFKRHTGKTPTEYRNEMKGINR